MATYTYKGTKITGTSTSKKKFKKSGVKKAKKGDTYLNTAAGHVYQCTDGGGPKDAKWKYIRTDIIKAPALAVTDLATPSRQTPHKAKATWKVPKDLASATKGNRATDLEITWWLDGEGTKDKKKVIKTTNEKATSSTIDLDAIWGRGSWYPFNGKPKLWGVNVSVLPKNAKGKGKKKTSAKLTFGIPRIPTISALAFNSNTGVVSGTITTNAGTDRYERYDTRYSVHVENSQTKSSTYPTDTYSTNTSIPVSFNCGNYQALSYSNYIRVTVNAWARGYAGASKTATREIYVSYPAQVTITGVSLSSTSNDGKCTVGIKTNSTKAHPVDQVRLEYIANCDYEYAEDIPGDAWTSTDIVDDKNCSALAIGVSALRSERGKHTWVRVKSYHLNENVLYRYSRAVEVKALHTTAATAADDDIEILSAVAGGDGTSIVTRLGWNKDGTDDSTGTELTWSDEENTWKSTEEPSKHTFTWSDGPVYELTEDTSIVSGKKYYTRTGEGTESDPYVYTEVATPVVEDLGEYYEVTYKDGAEITIKALEEGEAYFIRARRYLEGETTTYSDYSNTAACITSETPETVVATCERYVPTGASLPIYWTFAGNSLQTAWQIVDSNGTVIANGEGSIGSTRIDADRLAAFAINNELTFTVQVSTGSGFIVSESHTITILDAPTLSISTAATLTAQPFSFSATASSLCDLKVIVSSLGASGQFPTGVLTQTAGDTIYSDIYAPIWTAEQGGTYTADITLPPGLDFWDLGKYSLTVVAIDRMTELQSEQQIANFEVGWTAQAPSVLPTVTYSLTADTEVDDEKPYYSYDSETQTYIAVLPEGTENPSEEGWYEQTVTDYVTLTPVDTTSDQGVHIQAVQIELKPPAGCVGTELYDIYRMTGDGARLIGQGFPLTYTAQDNYAPFGEDMTLYYRIAIRTVDGDISFSDFEYVQDCTKLRFDWAGGTLELPYNLSIGDKYKKDVEIRKHMDGNIDGYWNSNIERTASFSSDVIRLIQQDEIDSARALARYPGAVFVRTPDGSAYEADVQVTDLSTEGVMAAIAIDATEVGLTQEFILPTPYTFEEPEESGGSGGE